MGGCGVGPEWDGAEGAAALVVLEWRRGGFSGVGGDAMSSKLFSLFC